jgi:hypothetical protein
MLRTNGQTTGLPFIACHDGRFPRACNTGRIHGTLTAGRLRPKDHHDSRHCNRETSHHDDSLLMEAQRVSVLIC